MFWIIVALLWSGIFVIDHWSRWVVFSVALVATTYQLLKWRYYRSSCWRREYFPLIHHFAFLGGAHVAAADLTGREYDPETAFPTLLKHRYPNWTEAEIKAFIATNRERFRSGFYKRRGLGVRD